MRRHTLAVSWLHDQFAAAWVDASGETAHWVCPHRIGPENSLSNAVREALHQAGRSTRRIAWLVDHRSLLFHIQETPPVKGRLIRPLMDRLVAENRFFDEPAVWAKLPLPGTGRRQRWLLSIMPSSLWREIESASDDSNLTLTGVYPANALLGAFLPRISAGPEEVVLVLTDFGNAHGLLVGRGDGQILFARSIARSTHETDDRLGQEINRTLHFVQQRFGGEIYRMIAVGSDDYASLIGRRIQDDLTVECLLTELSPARFASHFATYLGELTLDLSLGRRRQPAWVRPALALGMVLLLSVSIVTSLLLHSEAADQLSESRRLNREARAAAEIIATRETRIREANRLHSFLDFVGARQTPPIAPTFLRYLGTSLPPSLRLTSLTISKATNGWHFRFEGLSREQGSRFVSLLEDLESHLAHGIFRAQITDRSHQHTLSEATGASRIAGPPTQRLGLTTPSEERPFFLAGTIP